MATKNTALRNINADDLGALFDGGSIEFLDSGATVIGSVTLQSPAFGSASSGQIVAAGLPLTGSGNASAGAGTTIDSARLVSSGSTYTITALTVGTSGTQVVLDNTSVADGQQIEVSSFNYTVDATVN